MGWRVTVKAGRVRDMKNKRKTGKSGKKRWVGGALSYDQKIKYTCFPRASPDLLCNYDENHNRYQDIRPFIVNDIDTKHIASYVPVMYLSDEHTAELTTAELTAWNTDLDKRINCGNYDIHNPNRQPYNLNDYIIQDGDFILSEAPINTKFYDFWDIVITKKIDVIVMLTNLIEKGKPKADKYFSDSNNNALVFNGITVVSTTHNVDKNFEISTFTVTKSNVSHTVKHLWYKVWPDHGVVDIKAFNTLIQTYYDHTNHTSKTLVHCSAGVGRTGTFVAALLYCRFHKKIDIDCIILFLRRCRMMQVQTEEQYNLLITEKDGFLQRPDATAATHAAAANPAQPAATVAAAAATESSVPAGTYTLVMHHGQTKQVNISTTSSANSIHHGALQPQLHASFPPQPTKPYIYPAHPAYAKYAAPKDKVNYGNNFYGFIFDLPVFLYPNTENKDTYRDLCIQILNGTKNMYILRPCIDQQLHHFVITWNDTTRTIKEKTILIVGNKFLKLEDLWTGPIERKPQHYDALFIDLADIIRWGLNETIKPLKIYNEHDNPAQNGFLGLTLPQSLLPYNPISPAQVQLNQLQEEMQHRPVPTQPLEKAIDIAQPAAARPVAAVANPAQPAAVDAASVQPTPLTPLELAPNTTLTIAPTGTVPEPLLISFASIVGKASGSTAKSTTYIFNDGNSITTEPLNKQEYKCTISPSPNLIAQP